MRNLLLAALMLLAVFGFVVGCTGTGEDIDPDEALCEECGADPCECIGEPDPALCEECGADPCGCEPAEACVECGEKECVCEKPAEEVEEEPTEEGGE
ncbi:MAG: hypothetical protein GY771_15225 [bacterium]|nr:hypothetical protein [bacterium]